MIKVETKPIENNMAGFNWRLPFQRWYIVKAFTADGIAINNVVNVNTEPKKWIHT